MFSASIVDIDVGQFEVVDARSLVPVVVAIPEPGGGHRKYRQAKQAAARTVLEAKTRVWEEFGEAMEEDYRSASKRDSGKPQPPGKVYARVLERRIRPIVDPRIQEEQCGFRPGRGTVDQLYTLRRVLEGLWEFAQPVHMCFVDLEKASFDRVPRGILWGVLHEYGVRGPLLRAVRSLYDRSRSLVRIAGNDVVLLASSSQDLQHVLERFAAECEAAGMRISTSKSEAMVLDRKRVVCPLRVSGEVLPQVEEFKYLGVLFTKVRERWSVRLINRRIGAASAVMRSVYRTVVVKKELSRKAKLSIYRSIYVPTLTYGHELWGGVPGVSHREEASGKTQDTRWRDYVSRSAGLGTPRGSPGRAGGSVWGQRLFRRSGAGSDSFSETSSIGQAEETNREGSTNPSDSVHPPASPPAPEGDSHSASGVAPENVQEWSVQADTQAEERQPEGQEVEQSGR
ncbi:hypothetical protein L3Q82_002893 [Scortum barcoo]|uniref:Uncharacterized protein n=1 Tax=Scortum barcoo TaxID=214431 RepID=A0ACB8VV78_9TELE|nr:hypothetical protein L3Q82_002893 [Scortum barcoo]